MTFFKSFYLIFATILALTINVCDATEINIEILDPPGVGFNDNTPATPIGGNPGTTIGEQRLNVFKAAAEFYERVIDSSVPITVNGHFDDLYCGSGYRILGQAYNISYTANFINAPLTDTWYPTTLANAYAGSIRSPGSDHINIVLSHLNNIGDDCTGYSDNWWYGLPGSITTDKYANYSILYHTILHEIAHGLGFITLVSSAGELSLGYPDVFTRNLKDLSTGKLWVDMTDAERAASRVNDGNVVWVGPTVTQNASNLTSGLNSGYVKLDVNPYGGGKAASHWDVSLTPDEILEEIQQNIVEQVPIIDLTVAALYDIGWKRPELGPGYFTFNGIADQQIDIPFEVTLTAKDSNDNPDTSFNGPVALASTSVIGPTSINLVNGTATFTVTGYDQGYTKLNASAGERTGNSNEFSVTGTDLCESTIRGSVLDLRGDGVAEATVTITNQQSGTSFPTSADSLGIYIFSNKPCGQYDLQAEKDGAKNIPISVSVTNTLPHVVDGLILPLNGSSEDLPTVVLIPGMAGSSIANGSPYPKLRRTTPMPADRLELHNFWPDVAGWETLKDELWEGGFNTVDCPWDWRLPFDVAYWEYLIPCIDDAKKLNSAAVVAAGNKVHVIAHSMGGLVTRAYIQSDEYQNQDRGDISKFAIVGTPHLGSPDAYYIWEGGEPKVIDDIKENIQDAGLLKSALNFYTNTIQNLGEETYGDFPDLSDDEGGHENEVHDFVHSVAPSLGQLMSTEAMLNVNANPDDIVVATAGNRNVDLITLNSDPDIQLLFTNTDEDEDKVHAGLFVGDNQEFSITTINVGVSDDNRTLYKDGRPWLAVAGVGDGTVPFSSATWPADQGWAELVMRTSEVPTSKVKHSGLVKEFAEEICLFLKKSPCTPPAARAQSVVVAGPTSQLAFSLSGGARISVTDPDGNNFGHDPATGDQQEEVLMAEFLFDNEGGGLATQSVTDGTYHVSVFGVPNRDFFLDVSYMTETMSETVDLHGFYSGTLVQFDVVVDSTTAPYLTIVPPAQVPENLQANPAGAAGSGNTVLTWIESTEPDVTDYRVYVKGKTDPFFSLVSTVAFGTATYVTTDLWALDATNPVKTYYVTAIKSDGSESFFGNAARNNDRDHDGVSDADETANGTNPEMEDTEGDGLSDSEERNYGTDPLMSDTDDDKVGDALETQLGSDPLDDTSLPQVYDDITPDHPHYYLATLGLKVAGIVNDCDGARQFCPDQLITRDTVAIWLIKAYEGENYTPPNAIGTVFADITIDTFAADFIEDLMVHSGTDGCDTVPNYCPQQTLTKAQAVKMLLKTKYGAGYSPSLPSGTIFDDVSVGTFAAGFIEDLNTEGAAEGCLDSPPLYCPREMMTRGGFAKMLANTFGLMP